MGKVSPVEKLPAAPGFRRMTAALIRREAVLEWRMKYVLGGVALYLLAVVLLIYLTADRPEGTTWSLLYWIAVLFTAANAVAKSFLSEGEGRQLYVYTLAPPEAVMAAKLLYNTALMIALAGLGLAAYAAVAGFPVQRPGTFILAVLAGAAAFAAVFSMVSAVASRAAGTGTLMAILGFPLLVPVLRAAVDASSLALLPGRPFEGAFPVLVIAAAALFTAVLSMVLFPYLWRD